MIPFADIEAMINNAVHSSLSNATMTYGIERGAIATSVDGILDDKRQEPEAVGTPRGVRSITFELLEASAASLAAGMQVSIRNVIYAISRIERDKTGWVTLHLRGGVV